MEVRVETALRKQERWVSNLVVSLQPCDGPLLPLQVHYHGKPISVNVSINNCTNKVIKKIKISGELLFLSPCTRARIHRPFSKTLSHLVDPHSFSLSLQCRLIETFISVCLRAHPSAPRIAWPRIRSHLRAASRGLRGDWLIIVMCFSWLFSWPDHRCCPVFTRQVHQDCVHAGVHVSWRWDLGQRDKGWGGGKRAGAGGRGEGWVKEGVVKSPGLRKVKVKADMDKRKESQN